MQEKGEINNVAITVVFIMGFKIPVYLRKRLFCEKKSAKLSRFAGF
jgi:hypothetical protein